MVKAVVHLLAVTIVVVGGAIELRDALRQRRDKLTQDEALQRLKGELHWVTFPVCAGLASAAIVFPTLWRDSSIGGWDMVLLVLALGMAGDRASYLVKTYWRTQHRSSHRVAAIIAGAVSVVGGLAVGIGG